MGIINGLTRIVKCSAIKKAIASKGITSPIKQVQKLLFNLGISNKAGNVMYEIKPGITIPINPKTLYCKNPTFEIDGLAVNDKNFDHLAELGNVSVRLAEKFFKADKSIKELLMSIYSGAKEITTRPKGANSILSKLIRRLSKGKNLSFDSQAVTMVLDGNGGRVTLPEITEADVKSCIENARYYGRKLTSNEKSVVTRYFNGEKLTKSERKLAEKYARNIKLDLAEKQMQPQFEETMVSAIRSALDRGVTTPIKLEKAGIDKNLIIRAQGKDVKPAKLIDVNNYSGNNGIPFFSNSQIKQFEALQKATGDDIEIISCPSFKRTSSKLNPLDAKSIKAGGYTRGQITLQSESGDYIEVQFKEVKPKALKSLEKFDMAEIDHLKYDASLEKNTLPEICQPFVRAYKRLTYDQKIMYDKYLKQWFNYDRNLGLHCIGKKPELPKGFDEILSVESLDNIHTRMVKDNLEKMKDFVPNLQYKLDCSAA